MITILPLLRLGAIARGCSRVAAESRAITYRAHASHFPNSDLTKGVNRDRSWRLPTLRIASAGVAYGWTGRRHPATARRERPETASDRRPLWLRPFLGPAVFVFGVSFWGQSVFGAVFGVRPVLGTKQLLLQIFDGPLQLGRALLDAAGRLAEGRTWGRDHVMQRAGQFDSQWSYHTAVLIAKSPNPDP